MFKYTASKTYHVSSFASSILGEFIESGVYYKDRELTFQKALCEIKEFGEYEILQSHDGSQTLRSIPEFDSYDHTTLHRTLIVNGSPDAMLALLEALK